MIAQLGGNRWIFIDLFKLLPLICWLHFKRSRKALRVIYTIIYLHLLPLVIMRLYWRSLQNKGYRQRLGERFGLVPPRQSNRPLIWFHAVSVGEVLTAVGLIKSLQAKHPEYDILITTTTLTGSERVKAIFSGQVLHYYLPYDVPSVLRAFLTKLKPNILIIMETELWPNLLATCEQQKVPVLLVNARMSQKSFQGYAHFKQFSAQMLQSLQVIAAQSQADASRLIDLGANDEQVIITPSLKFDIELTPAMLQQRDQFLSVLPLQDKKVIIFASTHPNEDEMLMPKIQLLLNEHEEVFVLIAPRHPERFDIVERLLNQHHIGFDKLSSISNFHPHSRVLLIDTMGDLLACYGLADIAFVGGTLIEHGGHNFLEPSLWSLAICSGPSVYNFQEIADQLIRQQALSICQDAAGIIDQITHWLGCESEQKRSGVSANQFLQANQGATETVLLQIEQQLNSA